jgi:hypothetical protein
MGLDSFMCVLCHSRMGKMKMTAVTNKPACSIALLRHARKLVQFVHRNNLSLQMIDAVLIRSSRLMGDLNVDVNFLDL